VRGRYNPQCQRDITPYDFLSDSGKPRLEVDPLFAEIKIIMDTSKKRNTVGNPGLIVPSLFPIANAQPALLQQNAKAISADSANRLYQAYKYLKSPISKMQLQKEMSRAGEPYMVIIADSLKNAVAHGQKDKAAEYAQILTNFKDLGQLASSGRYAYVLDDDFYEHAVESLRSTNENESRSIALFLKNMQDARCLKHVFQEYGHANTSLAKRLYILILEGFSTNSDNRIKDKVRDWLQQSIQNESSSEIRNAMKDALDEFAKSH
jgi:hypothetical protein